jgi:transcriptional regulator with XRE-family HTH domain
MTLKKSRTLAAKRLIGRRIMNLRKARNLTQIDLATRVELTQGIVSEWERGERLLTYPDAWRLAVSLGVTMDDLVGPPKGAKEVQFFNAAMKQQQSPESDDDPGSAPRMRRRPTR